MREPPYVLFEEYGTQLRMEPDDSLVLNVICGRIGEFMVEFRLNDDERRDYREGGDQFIKELSRKVQFNWRPYIARE